MTITAAEYNVQRIRSGAITVAALAAFVDMNDLVAKTMAFQKSAGLKEDGKLGPKTMAALLRMPKIIKLNGPVHEPILGGCWWSRNAFESDRHWGRDGFCGPKTEAGGWPLSGGKMVVAIAAGKVTKVHTQPNGFWIHIDHGSEIISLSGHLEDKGLVKVGDQVKAGDPLGPLYKKTHPPHIHFQLSIAGVWQDPAPLLDQWGATAFSD